MEFPLAVRRGLFVTSQIKAQSREKGLSGDTAHTVPLRPDSIGSLFWGLSPLLPLKESSVKRMKINVILQSRSGWREPQTRYWKTKAAFFTHDTLSISMSPQHFSQGSWFSSPSFTIQSAGCQLQLVLSTKWHMPPRPTVHTKERTGGQVSSLQKKKSDHVLIAGLRPKGFSCESVKPSS